MKLSDIDDSRLSEREVEQLRFLRGKARVCNLYEDQRILDGLEHRRNDVETRLAEYHAQPDCPFCRHRYGWATAKLVDSKTQGRLECERCGAQALVGHCAAKRWDE